jgi:CheY-like chemotaxis protein
VNLFVVEDNATDRKLMCAVLESSGHCMFGVDSAEKALEEIKVRQPDAILLDLKLPGMDGLTLARLLKQDSETRGIPIVAITAGVEAFSKQASLRAGCDAYIVKPMDTRKLATQILSATSKQSAVEQR